MIWKNRIVAALLAATGVQAGGIGDLIVEGMIRGNPSYERRMAEVAKRSLVLRGAMLEIRQTQGPEAVMNPNGTLNMTLWEAIANSACVEALRALPEASNPSGTCVCYNLPVLNQTQGTFLADLRLYRLGTATGDFAGIPPEKIEVGLRYRGASVSPTSPETAAQKVVGARLDTRQSPGELNGDLKLLQTYMFIGQIDKEQMKADMTMGELQEFLLPVVTLSGQNAQNQVVSTNVSTTEAAFVAGVFSDEVVMSSFGVAELAVQDEIARLKNGTSAFQLPGVQILIFPIGLIITSIWLVLGLAAYGYGTFCRYNFREQYRRRMLIQQKGSVARF